MNQQLLQPRINLPPELAAAAARLDALARRAEELLSGQLQLAWWSGFWWGVIAAAVAILVVWVFGNLGRK